MPTNSLGRRLRFARTRTGKRLVLGERDAEILRWLYRYRYLRQSHLVGLLRPTSTKRFTERLGDLFHETGFINRPAMQGELFDARSTPMLYEISNAGIAWLQATDRLPPRAVTFSRRSGRSYSPQFLHTMAIIEALLVVERQTIATSGQRFVPFDEILAKAPEATRQAPNPLAIPLPDPKNARRQSHLIPDALYGIEYLIDGEKGYRFWALECERTAPAWRSTAEASSTARKQAAYDALIQSRAYRQHWGVPNLKLHLVMARQA